MINKSELGVELPPEPNIWWIGVMSAPAIGLLRLPELFSDFTPRDILPEPLDVFDHIGNPAAMCAGAFALGLGRAMFRDEKVLTEDEYNKANRRYAVGAAMLTIAANAYGEMVGYGDFSVADPIDFGYGLLAGFCAYKAFKTSFTSEEQMDEELSSTSSVTFDSDPETYIKHRRYERIKEKIKKNKAKKNTI